MKHVVIFLAALAGVAIVYGLWLFGESLQLKNQGRPAPYLELLRQDLEQKREWLNR